MYPFSSLYLLVGAFNPFTFKVIIDIYVDIDYIIDIYIDIPISIFLIVLGLFL